MKTLTKILVSTVGLGFAVSSFAFGSNGGFKMPSHGSKYQVAKYYNHVGVNQQNFNNGQVAVGGGLLNANVNAQSNFSKLKSEMIVKETNVKYKPQKMKRKNGGSKHRRGRNRR